MKVAAHYAVQAGANSLFPVSPVLFLFFVFQIFGKLCKIVARIAERTSKIIGAAVHRDGTTGTRYIVVAMGGLDDVAAVVAANDIAQDLFHINHLSLGL